MLASRILVGRFFAVLAVAGLPGTIAVAPPAGAQLRFEDVPPTFTVLSGIRAMDLSDLDGDGRPDMAIAHSHNAVSVCLSGEPCGFLTPRLFTVGANSTPSAIVAGDWNGDGYVDLACAKQRVKSVAILFGDGTGGFTWSQNPSIGTEPNAMIAADFDADGRLDLAIAGEDAKVVALLRGDGVGFSIPAVFVSFIYNVKSLAAADFDENGHLDLVVGLGLGDAAVLLGDGSFGFGAPIFLPGAGNSRQVATADFDADGHADVAVATGTESIVVALGDGAGSFATSSFSLPGDGFHALAVFDTDDDGALDLAVADEFVRHLFIVPGIGDGTFGAARLVVHGYAPVLLATIDWNLDGHADLFSADRVEPADDGLVTVFQGDGSGHFPSVPSYPAGPSPRRVAVADFDDDGLTDVAAVGIGTSILLNDGASGLEPPLSVPAGSNPESVVAADLDADGHEDLVLAHPDLEVLYGDGSGSFPDIRTLAVPLTPWRADVADFDEDGHLDIVVATAGEERDEREVHVLVGDGARSFSPGVSIPAGTTRALVVADFDVVGHADIAFRMSTSVHVYLGDGAGGFTFADSTPTGSEYEFKAGDLDGDGRLDLVSICCGRIATLIGDGLGDFEFVDYGPIHSNLLDLDLADWDEDGRLDVVAAGRGGLMFLRGNGGGLAAGMPGSTDLQQSFGAHDLVRDVVSVDFDGDGHRDLVAANSDSNDVSVLLNRSFEADPCSVRLGNVNAAAGEVTPVLFVNGLKGAGPARRLFLDRFALFVLRIKAPPSKAAGPSHYAVFASIGPPTEGSVTALPYGFIGTPPLAAKKTWNNTGNVAEFGAPDFPSIAAPEVVLRRDAGVRKRITFYLQGVLEDSASPSGVYAITNGIEVVSR